MTVQISDSRKSAVFDRPARLYFDPGGALNLT